MSASLSLVVLDAVDAAPGVRSLSLADPSGATLPSYTPGSHVVVEIPAGEGRERPLANAYSLTGESLHPDRYSISVLHVPHSDGGHGGSAWMHTLGVGSQVQVLPPRSAFAPVRPASRHLLLGAGIGVTPLVSHLRSHARWGAPVEVLHLARPGQGAHLDDLVELGGDAVTLVHDRATWLTILRGRLRAQPMGTHLYTCGPAGFMDTVVAEATVAGWPAGRVHLEHFGIDALAPGEPFTVGVDGDVLDVPSGVSLLEALEEAGREIPSLCRQGVCGECRLKVGSATGLLHRDLYLTDDDKAAGDCVMACVSRAQPGADGRSHLEVLL
ncbi:PDR/VanB family oxidoreductase [Nocardioides acrostichi]|uniref:Oxidoreductase n=1 Tax=Nocardioides acrostichi TaxID=2784339 RepID=A0A930V0H2_9ACTN|nr:PDR/VanB family oxidoreductase [Nocardioides acrostichi]MBF4162415.1 oxidoreductase [Nocardioides acrostichi]